MTAVSSTLLDDRKNAMCAFKSLSKKYHSEVVIQDIEHCIQFLQTDH